MPTAQPTSSFAGGLLPQFHMGILYIAPHVAAVVRYGQHRPQRPAALDLEGEGGPIYLQHIPHHGGGQQGPPQGRGGHRQQSVDPRARSTRSRPVTATALTRPSAVIALTSSSRICFFLSFRFLSRPVSDLTGHVRILPGHEEDPVLPLPGGPAASGSRTGECPGTRPLAGRRSIPPAHRPAPGAAPLPAPTGRSRDPGGKCP